MSLELLYTSATSGLKQGSRGFCTVLSTTGMPINLATKLETLSGYRHVYPPQDPNADQNPVGFSHLKLSLGGNRVSVLSRISAYGVDYSGRTNKLAHHVVLNPQEQPPAGPAWVLSQSTVMRESWDGQNQTLANGPSVAMLDQAPKVCDTWKLISGDAGWGGYVASSLANASPRPLWIVFEISHRDKLLNLVNESIALLPPAQRWNATFSTYYTTLPPEIDCRVRCVLAGTEEARLAAARGYVLDLTRPCIVPTDSRWIQIARSGVVPQASTTPPEVADVTTNTSKSFYDDSEQEFALMPSVASASKRNSQRPPSISVPGLPPAVTGSIRNANSPELPTSERISKSRIISIFGLAVALLLVVTAVGLAIYRHDSKKAVASREAAISEPVQEVIEQPQSSPPDDPEIDKTISKSDEKKSLDLSDANSGNTTVFPENISMKEPSPVVPTVPPSIPIATPPVTPEEHSEKKPEAMKTDNSSKTSQKSIVEEQDSENKKPDTTVEESNSSSFLVFVDLNGAKSRVYGKKIFPFNVAADEVMAYRWGEGNANSVPLKFTGLPNEGVTEIPFPEYPNLSLTVHPKDPTKPGQIVLEYIINFQTAEKKRHPKNRLKQFDDWCISLIEAIQTVDAPRNQIIQTQEQAKPANDKKHVQIAAANDVARTAKAAAEANWKQLLGENLPILESCKSTYEDIDKISGEEKHEPSLLLRIQQLKNLIEALTKINVLIRNLSEPVELHSEPLKFINTVRTGIVPTNEVVAEQDFNLKLKLEISSEAK